MARTFAHIATLVFSMARAGAPIAANTFVAFNGQTAGADASVAGLAKTDAVAGDAVALIGLGIVEMAAATAIAAGAKVYSDAAGKATSVGANNPVGRALKAAANPGDTVTILFKPL